MTTSPNALPAALDAATLRELIDSGRAPRLLDVRTPAEFETAHVPGAYNVPLDVLREHREELRRHLDETVVLICRSGARAARAGQALAGVGRRVLGPVFVPGLKWVAGLIGAGLTFAAVADTCALGRLLGRLPYNRGASCDVETVVGRLGDHPTPRPLP
ncbi:rhodanese-like domain-containing protein [Micromonospora echinofusca]|uniref:rhodanese-like domain-containing protein n=1 Tax=Micromonospora echinofusca TaxID=47858 RepID=UPI003424E3B8